MKRENHQIVELMDSEGLGEGVRVEVGGDDLEAREVVEGVHVEQKRAAAAAE